MIKKALNWLKTALNDRITAILDQFDNNLDRELRDLTWDRPVRPVKSVKSVKSTRDFSKPGKSASKPSVLVLDAESAPVIDPLPATDTAQLDLFIDKVKSAVDADADHAVLCDEIDQMLSNTPDYDGSACPTGDHPIVIDGFQPVMELKTPKLQ